MEIMITIYENELRDMVDTLDSAKRGGESSAIYSKLGERGIDVDFQLIPTEDKQLKAKKQAAEERGDL